MKTTLLSAVALLAFDVAAGAPELSGRWTLVLDPDFSGNNVTVVCEFAQQRQELTLECDELGVAAGTIDDDLVKFVVMTGPDNLLPARFTGTLSRNERTIAGTWRLEDVTGNRIGRFTATAKAGGE